MKIIDGPIYRATTDDSFYEHICSIETERGRYDVSLWWGNEGAEGTNKNDPSWCVRYGENGYYSSGRYSWDIEAIINNHTISGSSLPNGIMQMADFYMHDEIHKLLAVAMLIYASRQMAKNGRVN